MNAWSDHFKTFGCSKPAFIVFLGYLAQNDRINRYVFDLKGSKYRRQWTSEAYFSSLFPVAF